MKQDPFYKTKDAHKIDDNIENRPAEHVMQDIAKDSTTGPGSAPPTGGTRNNTGGPAAATGIRGNGE